MTITQEQLDKQQMVVVFHWSAERRERVISRSLEYPEITREDEIIWPDVMGREAIKKETHRVGAKVVGEQEILTEYNHLLDERKERPILVMIGESGFDLPAKVWTELDREFQTHAGNIELLIPCPLGVAKDAAVYWAKARGVKYSQWPEKEERAKAPRAIIDSLSIDRFSPDRIIIFAMPVVGNIFEKLDIVSRAREEWIPYRIVYRYPWEDGAVEQAVAP